MSCLIIACSQAGEAAKLLFVTARHFDGWLRASPPGWIRRLRSERSRAGLREMGDPDGACVELERHTVLFEPTVVSNFDDWLGRAAKIVGTSIPYPRLERRHKK